MAGLLGLAQDGADRVPPEEIRFGLILNGGVSLAVWMGGTVLELDRLTSVRRDGSPAAGEDRGLDIYTALLALAGGRARADVIAGTSAGGINGAALALSQVNPQGRLPLLRDVWVDQGRIESLLRQPFRGSPTSLLRGDEFFLPQLNTTLGLLAQPGTRLRSTSEAPVDLSITTTVLHGNQRVTVDSMGQPLPQSIHGARFHWERLPGCELEHAAPDGTGEPDPRRCADPFGSDCIERTADRLALAARCTASFPVAFEPVFVPVNSAAHREPQQGTPLTEEQRLRPDMGLTVEDWGDRTPRDRSRFVVDGGLLANTPTRAALGAVESMPADGPVRRVMLLVYPHAQAPGPDPADEQTTPPTLSHAVGGILGALTAQGSRTFVDELEDHNAYAASRRGTRSDVLRSLVEPRSTDSATGTLDNARTDPHERLEELTLELYPHYRRLRKWRAARDLSRWAVNRPPRADGLQTLPPGWNYERVRRAAESAQLAWDPTPYLPNRMPVAGTVEPDGWRWGVTSALGVAEAAMDVLRRLVWVLPRAPRERLSGVSGPYEVVREARETVSRLTGEIRRARDLTDHMWDTDPRLLALRPDRDYWLLRLASYERLMIGQKDKQVIEDAIARVAHSDAEARDLRALLVREDEHGPGSAGSRVRALVTEVVQALRSALPELAAYCEEQSGTSGAREHVAELRRWRAVLMPSDEALEDRFLLPRLLQLEVAATTLGDEVTTGATLPVEVVQLSAQTANAFAQYTHTGEDKLGGMSVSRFGGFLKRSWRVNDWTWGRVDAASHLCRVVLDPSRLRRTALLTGYLEPPRDGSAALSPRERAEETVGEIVDMLFGDEVRTSRILELQEQAVAELEPVMDPAVASENLDSALPALADLFAWALHLQIVPSEMPALAGAVRADGVDGANARSRGEAFVAEHGDLLSRLSSTPVAQLAKEDRAAALMAFDRAGVGREPLTEEGSSDQMIRTATTAAAVAATVVDSDRAGLPAAKPVTRVLRGAMLLPYWVVTGLSGKGVVGRSVALLGLAVGAVLLALALFGVLPQSLAGPGAAVGASALLIAFVIGALRSGTMLHGLVLLTPVVPLVAFAVEGGWSGDGGGGDGLAGAATASERGVTTLLVVLALAAGLMVLGSLPATSGSVLASLDRLAERHRLPAVGGSVTGTARGRAQLVRRSTAVALSLAGLVWWVVLALGVLALALWLAGDRWDTTVAWARDHLWLLVPLGVLAVLVGAGVSYVLGRQLQVLSRRQASGTWTYQPLTHPAGSAAGWAVLYGTAYLLLAAFLLTRESWLEEVWVRALLSTAVLLGVGLVVVVPLLLPLRALLEIARREVTRASEVTGPPLRPRAAVVDDMVARGTAYRCFVTLPTEEAATPQARPDEDEAQPRLRAWTGDWLYTRMERECDRRAQESAGTAPPQA
jgi:patatin-related protein